MPITDILLATLVALLAAAFYISRRNLNYWQRRGIPCDTPHWLYGNLNDVPKKYSLADAFTKVYKRYLGSGPFCGFYFLQTPSVLALSPDFVKHVLIKDFNSFVDRGVYSNEKDDPLTGQLFRLDGRKWRQLRNKLTPTFTAGQMRFMLPTILEVAEQFVETIDVELQKNEITEIKEIMARFTTDVIGSCAFGIECNSLKNPDAIFRQMGKRFFSEPRHSNFVGNMIDAAPDLARRLHVRIVDDDVTEFFIKIVREAVDYRQKNNVQRKDFLNILIDLNKGALKLDKNSDGRPLTLEEMTAQVFVFFLAGFETSSSTLSFMLYELAQNQEIQKRMREEILEILERHGNEVTYECVNGMPYMKQVIAETLRKYPILPKLQRVAVTDYVVPEHPNYNIEKGTLVIIPVMAIHHNPEIYTEPEKFNPDRFAPEKMQERDSINWLPFGAGPRNCIGLRFGQMQMRVALIYLLRNFEFSNCHLTEIPLQMANDTSLTTSQNGIHLKVQRIVKN